MRNSPGLPILSLIGAFVLGALAIIPYKTTGAVAPNEIEIGLLGVSMALGIFGVQGLLSVLLEGQELHLGRIAPRITTVLSILIVVFTFGLVAVAVATGYGIFAGWKPQTLGIFFGLGSLVLAAQLIFYKEAFIGDETRFDEREDGLPW